MTKYDLRQYRSLQREISDLRQKISVEDSKIKACIDGEALYGEQYKKHKARLQEALELAERQYGALEDAIATLSSEERMLIRYRYIDGWDWVRIADKCHYTDRNVHYIHSNALEKLKDIKVP